MQDLRVHQDHHIPEDHPQAVLTREDQAAVAQAAHRVLILHHQEVVAVAVHPEPIRHLQGAALRVAQADHTQEVAVEAAAAEVVAEAVVAAEPDAGNNKSDFLN